LGEKRYYRPIGNGKPEGGGGATGIWPSKEKKFTLDKKGSFLAGGVKRSGNDSQPTKWPGRRPSGGGGSYLGKGILSRKHSPYREKLAESEKQKKDPVNKGGGGTVLFSQKP